MSIKLLNTDEAARFLRVSEASIRRWSDAGLLRARRVGRRGERRFTEADLNAFMSVSRPGPARTAEAGTQVRIGGTAVPLGAHLTTFHSTDAGRLRLAVPLLADGLRVGQPCFLAASGRVLEAYLDGLRESPGCDVDEALRSHLLVTVDGPGVTVEDALRFWERQFWPALAGGPTILRVVGDMVCERQVFSSAAEMLRYEVAFNVMAKRFPTVTICQYDVREFDGLTVVDAIRSHPDMYAVHLGAFLN